MSMKQDVIKKQKSVEIMLPPQIIHDSFVEMQKISPKPMEIILPKQSVKEKKIVSPPPESVISPMSKPTPVLDWPTVLEYMSRAKCEYFYNQELRVLNQRFSFQFSFPFPFRISYFSHSYSNYPFRFAFPLMIQIRNSFRTFQFCLLSQYF